MPDGKYAILGLAFEREGEVWVGTCIETGVSTYADSLEDCSRELRELTAEHVEVLEETGERDDFFAECGVVVRDSPNGFDEFTFRASGDPRNGFTLSPMGISFN